MKNMFIVLLILALFINNSDTKEITPNQQPKEVDYPIPVGARGYDFYSNKGGWIMDSDYSDSEIRDLRNNNPNYIIRNNTGAKVLSTEEMIEDYIEENHEYILDEYEY